MTKHEFEDLLGREVSDGDFEILEDVFNRTGMSWMTIARKYSQGGIKMFLLPLQDAYVDYINDMEELLAQAKKTLAALNDMITAEANGIRKARRTHENQN